MSSKPNNLYMSNGQVLDKPPLTVRLSRFVENIYVFFGLYFVSLFSVSSHQFIHSHRLRAGRPRRFRPPEHLLTPPQFDPYSAAQNSKFNVVSSPNRSNTRSRWGGSSGGGGGGGSGGGGPGGPGGFGPRRIGRVDDVRGPECKSCG
ncbi:hypothetical protein BDW42DRAFT_18494 [Aspergillus taichungensis]|uniref:Uncharacterized protein n=1 Tax=Aspergillus taichungensis TaxID=482145 RepID=A0A2J5I5G8_9EURO|nr:hypothetical protein BDW42DRAFT_18494 [Aspergillus taichungensis]